MCHSAKKKYITLTTFLLSTVSPEHQARPRPTPTPPAPMPSFRLSYGATTVRPRCTANFLLLIWLAMSAALTSAAMTGSLWWRRPRSTAACWLSRYALIAVEWCTQDKGLWMKSEMSPIFSLTTQFGNIRSNSGTFKLQKAEFNAPNAKRI